MPSNSGKSEKKTTLNWIILGILFTFTLAGTFGIWYFQSLDASPQAHPETPVLFRIQSGDSLTEIAQKLLEKKLIQSELFLKVLTYWEGTGKSFKQGVFQIPPGATTREIHQILVRGESARIRLTIPEGLTLKKTAELLEEKGLVEKEKFLEAARDPELLSKYQVPGKSFEGLLFPDTYFFPYDLDARELLEILVKGFLNALEKAQGGEAKPDWYQKLILASIVEREYRVQEEAPLIASVFRNRVENRMKLGSCATVEYIITEIRGRPHPKRIFFEDTSYPSDYNTYLHLGLPPGPICSPGLTALKAAFAPPETDFLYFVVKDPAKGTHVFSKNYKDHNAARDDYLNSYFSKN